MKAMTPGKKFELWKPQAAVALAALRVVVIQEVPEVAIRAVAVGEAIHPTEDNKIPTRTLKTTPKCSR